MKTPTKQAIISAFNKAAGNYDAHASLQRDVSDRLFLSIQNKLSNNSIVLDGGCGTGYFHELLRKNRIYCRLMQFDIAFNMCKKAAEYASPVEYGGAYTFVSDVEYIPIANNSIDVAFSSLTLQWCNVNVSLSEIYRVLKDGGNIAVSSIGEGTLSELSEAFAEIDTISHINENFTTKEILKQHLDVAGFSDILVKEEKIVKHFKNLKEVMLSIKGVGASYKNSENRKYPGRKYFVKLEEIYQKKFENSDGLLPVTWKIVYAVAKK